MKTFKAALFDLDGTLLDTEGQYTEFWGSVGRKFLPDIQDFAQRIKGTTLVNILNTYFPDAEMQRKVGQLIADYETQMNYTLIAGAAEFVENLKDNGVRCAIVTSSDCTKMQNVQHAIGDFLARFDAILTAEDFSASKPDPDCYIRAAERLGTDRSECVVFEDAPNGLAAGTNAQMFVVGLATGNPREKIAPLCHRVIDNFEGLTFADINQWLNEL